MDNTIRTVKLILELERVLKHMQAAWYLSRHEPAGRSNIRVIRSIETDKRPELLIWVG